MALLLSFVIILILVLLNGLFVAAEFSIVGVRPSRLEQLAQAGNRTAGRMREVVGSIAKTNDYVATAQLGITLASLGLGMYAEPVIAHSIESPLHDWFGLQGPIIESISFFLSLSFITYLHVVLGEMVPKSLALQSSESMVLLLASPMRIMGSLFGLPIRVLNWIGFRLLELLRIPPVSEHSRLYTPEELELIVSESYRGGLLEKREQELFSNIFDFSERKVGQVMTPRTSIEAIPVDMSEAALVGRLVGTAFNRLPVYDGNIDNIVGVLHLKDFVRQQLSERSFDLRAILRQVPFVPESLFVDALLSLFRNQRLHMAIVIDEHGGTLGLVTLEDLIEEVVGEVRDEFDAEEEAPLTLVAPGHLIAQGTVLLETIEEYTALGDYNHDVQTIGGLTLAGLDLPPQEGDELVLGDVRVRVEAVDGLTIKRVSIRFPPQGEEVA